MYWSNLQLLNLNHKDNLHGKFSLPFNQMAWQKLDVLQTETNNLEKKLHDMIKITTTT